MIKPIGPVANPLRDGKTDNIQFLLGTTKLYNTVSTENMGIDTIQSNGKRITKTVVNMIDKSYER
jgi:hypothetical protein